MFPVEEQRPAAASLSYRPLFRRVHRTYRDTKQRVEEGSVDLHLDAPHVKPDSGALLVVARWT